MKLLARLISHGFAISVVLLLAIGFVYRGELFPGWKSPEVLTSDSAEDTDDDQLQEITEFAPVQRDAMLPANAAGERDAATPGRGDLSATRPPVDELVAPAPGMPAASRIAAADTDVKRTPADIHAAAVSPPVLEGADKTARTVKAGKAAAATSAAIVPPAAKGSVPGVRSPASVQKHKAPVTGNVHLPAGQAVSPPGTKKTASADTKTTAAADARAAAETASGSTSGMDHAASIPNVGKPHKPVHAGDLQGTHQARIAKEPAAAAPADGMPAKIAMAPASDQPREQVSVLEDMLEAGEAPAPAEPGVPVHPAAPADSTLSSYQLLALAREAYWMRDFRAAEDYYRQMIMIDPDNPDGFGELANMYFSQGEWESAAAAYYEAGLRLVEIGLLAPASQLVAVIRGLNGPQADALEHEIEAAQTDSQ